MGDQQSTVEELSSVVNALQVLQSFSTDMPRASISDMARVTGLSRPTARRVLITLRSQGFADTDGKSFWLTPKVLRLGYGFMASQPLADLAMPSLRQAGVDLNESCSMAALDGTDVIYLARVSLRRSVIPLGIGSRLPAYATSLGKVLLAFADSTDRESYLDSAPFERLTEHTETTRRGLLAQFDHIRKVGFAINDGEREIGVRSAAVPIIDREGSVIAAINVSANSARVSLEDMRGEFVPRLQQAADEINEIVQALPPSGR